MSSAHNDFAVFGGLAEGVDVAGRVWSPGRLSVSSLVERSCVHDDGAFGVPLVDLLAAVGLRREADVLLFTDRGGTQLGLPVRDVLSARPARLVIGPPRGGPASVSECSVRLDVEGWTTAAERFHPTTMTAMTFAEFVGGDAVSRGCGT